jgi:methionyl-tRNA formyltransferase
VRIAVAATAPFGADVLERLAARHEIALLLTRPDRPRGRGRRVAPTPAKVAAERLDIPVTHDLGEVDAVLLGIQVDPDAAHRDQVEILGWLGHARPPREAGDAGPQAP